MYYLKWDLVYISYFSLSYKDVTCALGKTREVN